MKTVQDPLQNSMNRGESRLILQVFFSLMNKTISLNHHTSGSLFVADSGNNVIRRVDSSSGNYSVSTYAGDYYKGPGFGDGSGNTAVLSRPTGITADAFGNLFFTDASNGMVRIVDSNKEVRTLSVEGPDDHTYYYDYDDDDFFDVFFDDYDDNDLVETVFRGVFGAYDRPFFPYGIVTDNKGNIYIADAGKHVIRRVVGQDISVIAGKGIVTSVD
jgi:streptogramin lyase